MISSHPQRSRRPALSTAAIVIAISAIAAGWASAQSASGQDSLLNQLQKSITGKVGQNTGQPSEFTIESISIRPERSTNLKWVKSQLLFHTDERMSLREWQRIASLQRGLLLDSQLYYDAKVYLLPGTADGENRAIVDLSDGFPYGFFFWPWDATVTWKHMLGGAESLSSTIGLNTQGLDWSDPVPRDLPFGYEVNLSHFLTYRDPGYIETGVQGGGKIYLNHGPVLRIGLMSNAQAWSLPPTSWLEPGLGVATVQSNLSALGLSPNATGSAVDAGGFLSVWPAYQFQRPFGYHLDIAGGVSVPIGAGGWYGGFVELNGVFFAVPVSPLLVELSVHVAGRPGDQPAVLFPVTGAFRSPDVLPQRSWLSVGSLEVMGMKLIDIPLGFTVMSVSPLAYLDAAETATGITGFSAPNVRWATGAGVVVGFGPPIGLYFTFGAKMGIESGTPVGFLFEADTRLF